METPLVLPVLEATELRVLGSLIEKSKTTPDYYPMTLLALTSACNQKSSRNPVVHYAEETVLEALNGLRKKGLVATATGGSSRAVKYKHNLTLVFPLLPPEAAVLCILILRGSQTAGELNANSGRLYEFDSLEEVQNVLEKLASSEPAFVQQLPRRPGRKEVRYIHLLGAVPDTDTEETDTQVSASDKLSLETRLSALEQELKELKQVVEDLRKEWLG